MRTDLANEDPAAGRRTRLAWYGFDLGNTAVEFAIPLYLTLWIVNDLGVPAWLFGVASAVSSWAIGLSGPYIGVSADETHRRRHWFVGSTVASTVLLTSLAFLPHGSTAGIALVLIAAIAGSYLFQLSSLIYNASLTSAAAGANVVSVSSLGMALSYLGGVAGVGIAELLTSGRLIPGTSGRGYAIVPVALIFLIFAVPSMFTSGLWHWTSSETPLPAQTRQHRIMELWRSAVRERFVGWFLAGFFALNSAIMGLTLYLPLHVEKITGLQGTSLLSIFGGVVAASAAGAGLVALLRPTGDAVRRIIVLGLALLALNCLIFSLASSLPLVVLCSCLHGLFSGALAPTVRGAFAQTFPSDYQALAFGLYGAVQRVSQGLGALLWPLVGVGAGSYATRLGIGAMGVVAVVGIPFFTRWRLVEQPE